MFKLKHLLTAVLLTLFSVFGWGHKEDRDRAKDDSCIAFYYKKETKGIKVRTGVACNGKALTNFNQVESLKDTKKIVESLRKEVKGHFPSTESPECQEDESDTFWFMSCHNF